MEYLVGFIIVVTCGTIGAFIGIGVAELIWKWTHRND